MKFNLSILIITLVVGSCLIAFLPDMLQKNKYQSMDYDKIILNHKNEFNGFSEREKRIFRYALDIGIKIEHTNKLTLRSK